jgi:cation diffusion facilitator CzcD-associated flavoprotein CzcO
MTTPVDVLIIGAGASGAAVLKSSLSATLVVGAMAFYALEADRAVSAE